VAMPVVAGEKPENERFPGAVSTYSIEAMMQDGKALQAGTSHFLGTTFSSAQDIKFQNSEGQQELAQTTSWGMSTRMIGGLIMTHGDDDGLRVPPRIAPWQVAIVPMLRDNDEDAALIDYCKTIQQALAKQYAFGEPVRALLDLRAIKAVTKRWGWIKKGCPIVVEVGGRDMAGGNVSVTVRTDLYKEDGKLNSAIVAQDAFLADAVGTLENVQKALFDQAKARTDANIVRDVTDFAGLEGYFEKAGKFPGWVEVEWAKPSGADLDKVVERLKALKLTFRNVPNDAAPATGTCIFTGAPAVERILVARAY